MMDTCRAQRDVTAAEESRDGLACLLIQMFRRAPCVFLAAPTAANYRVKPLCRTEPGNTGNYYHYRKSMWCSTTNPNHPPQDGRQLLLISTSLIVGDSIHKGKCSLNITLFRKKREKKKKKGPIIYDKLNVNKFQMTNLMFCSKLIEPKLKLVTEIGLYEYNHQLSSYPNESALIYFLF